MPVVVVVSEGEEVVYIPVFIVSQLGACGQATPVLHITGK